jgi:RNA polymerase sigma-70 factor (ECF subfamily)
VDFESSLKPHWDDFVRFSRSLAGSSDAGDDLLQDSMLRAMRSFGQLEAPDAFKQWVLRIISNTFRSQVRLSWIKRMVGLDKAAELPAAAPLPYEERELIRLALRSVPREQREAIILHEVLGLQVAEIAAIQKVTLSAVKSRLSRGRARLEERYRQLDNHSVTNESHRIRKGAERWQKVLGKGEIL